MNIIGYLSLVMQSGGTIKRIGAGKDTEDSGIPVMAYSFQISARFDGQEGARKPHGGITYEIDASGVAAQLLQASASNDVVKEAVLRIVPKTTRDPRRTIAINNGHVVSVERLTGKPTTLSLSFEQITLSGGSKGPDSWQKPEASKNP